MVSSDSSTSSELKALKVIYPEFDEGNDGSEGIEGRRASRIDREIDIIFISKNRSVIDFDWQNKLFLIYFLIFVKIRCFANGLDRIES